MAPHSNLHWWGTPCHPSPLECAIGPWEWGIPDSTHYKGVSGEDWRGRWGHVWEIGGVCHFGAPTISCFACYATWTSHATHHTLPKDHGCTHLTKAIIFIAF